MERMSDEDIVIIGWVDPSTGELVERALPADIAPAVMRGDLAFPRDAPERRYSAQDGQARLLARIDQLKASQDELMNE
jgi:hypothetical protein